MKTTQTEEFKVIDGSNKIISNHNIPSHPRMSIGDKLLFPTVNVKNERNVCVMFGKECQFKMNSIDDATKNIGKVLNLFTPGATIYTHWLFDLLPKIKCIQMAGLKIEDYDVILVNAKHSSFQKASISALGLDESKFLSIQSFSKEYYQCDLLTTISPVRKNYATSQWIINYIKEIFPPKETTHAFSDKIYISRSAATRRKVINEDDVVRHLKSKGFDILHCEDFTINEVNYILSNASMVVAPHGAGLANIAFCKPNTKVVELFSQHISPEYYYFAEILDLDYLAISCKDENGFYFNEINLDYKEHFVEINGADIYVDIEMLNNTL